MTKSVNNAARSLVLCDLAFVNETVSTVLAIASEVNAAELAVGVAKGKALPYLISRLTNVPAVTAKTWASDWARPTLAAYLASGVYAISAPAEKNAAGVVTKEAVSLPARSAASRLMVAVIGLTNGIEPLKSEALASYVNRARPLLKAKGILTATQGAKTKGEERKAPSAENKQARTTAALAFALAGKDKNFADKLAAVSGEYRPEFEAWFDTLMLMVARASK